jgi:hypothetical protein
MPRAHVARSTIILGCTHHCAHSFALLIVLIKYQVQLPMMKGHGIQIDHMTIILPYTQPQYVILCPPPQINCIPG